MIPSLVCAQGDLVFIKSVAELALPCFILREVFKADVTFGAVLSGTFKLTKSALKLPIIKCSNIILLFPCKFIWYTSQPDFGTIIMKSKPCVWTLVYWIFMVFLNMDLERVPCFRGRAAEVTDQVWEVDMVSLNVPHYVVPVATRLVTNLTSPGATILLTMSQDEGVQLVMSQRNSPT